MKNFFERYGLWIVLGIGIVFRAWHWFHVGGLFTRDGEYDVDRYLWICEAMWKGDWAEIAQYRPTQLFYPLLLSPVALWKWDVGSYIFILHQFLAAGTLYFVFRASEILFGRGVAFFSALLVALNWRMVGWFSWLYTETVYYFAIAFLSYASLRLWRERNCFNGVLYFLAVVIAFFVKPESIAAISASLFLLVFFYWERKCGFGKAVLSSLLVVVLFALCCGSSLFVSTKLQDKVLTHIHVAHGLYLSTRATANGNGVEQENAFNALRAFNVAIDPGNLQRYRNMSLDGLKFIRENPVRYFTMFLKRSVAILFPALYFDFSWASRIADALLSCVLVFGALGIFWAEHPEGRYAKGLVGIGLCMLALVGIYLADGDTRFRLPIYLVFSILAPYGWLLITDKILTFSVKKVPLQ